MSLGLWIVCVIWNAGCLWICIRNERMMAALFFGVLYVLAALCSGSSIPLAIGVVSFGVALALEYLYLGTEG